MNPTEVIKRLMMTEKAARLKEERPLYMFEVDKRANKTEIREAVQTLFKVDVVRVTTATLHGKNHRRGKFLVQQSDWKKVYNDVVNFLENPNDMDIFTKENVVKIIRQE